MNTDENLVNLEDIGNIDKYDIWTPRHVIPFEPIKSPEGIVIKFYELFKEQNLLNSTKTLLGSRYFLTKEIEEGRITPLSGFGFAITSLDDGVGYLNIYQWGNKPPTSPAVPIGVLYTSSDGFNSVTKEDINKVGPFCIWEQAVIGHETRAWKNYLKSPRDLRSKKNFLDDVIEGKI